MFYSITFWKLCSCLGVGLTPISPRSIILDSKVGCEVGEVGWLSLKVAFDADFKVKNE